ncbi:MAG: alpha/beta fold hydrolase [Bacteroidia bacterium]|nr:alpha/beta fold hydrolase [Bacteroidia bacterium]
MNLFYREFGNGEPILILHGLFGLNDNWTNIAKALSAQFKIYTLDSRNHGQSPRSNEWNYDVMAADINDFLTQHCLEKVSIIGHSMGGKTAMRFAEIYPEKLKKLIVVDIAPRYYPPHHQAVIETLDNIDFSIIKSRKDAEIVLRATLNDEGIIQFILKNIYWKENNQLDFRFNYSVIRSKINEIGEANFEHGICTTPTLFIRGENSNYINLFDEEEIYQKFTSVQITTVTKAGHWVHAENPADFLKVVNSFLT